ncbi:MAG: hypothetical protein HRT61_20475 [Ekhidna sp.]|nr:hypothetical protein [Ekhidna sp.]
MANEKDAISNGRCKACNREFGHRDLDEDLCTKCRPIALQAAYGSRYWDDMSLDDPAAEFLEDADNYGHTEELAEVERARYAYAESQYNDAYANHGWDSGYDY